MTESIVREPEEPAVEQAELVSDTDERPVEQFGGEDDPDIDQGTEDEPE